MVRNSFIPIFFSLLIGLTCARASLAAHVSDDPDAPLLEFIEELRSRSTQAKKPYYVRAFYKDLTWGRYLLEGVVENGGKISIHFKTHGGKLLGTMTADWVDKQFWYTFTFPKQKITIEYTYRFTARKDSKILMNPETNFDMDLFKEIQDSLWETARKLKVPEAASLFEDAQAENLSWLPKLIANAPH